MASKLLVHDASSDTICFHSKVLSNNTSIRTSDCVDLSSGHNRTSTSILERATESYVFLNTDNRFYSMLGVNMERIRKVGRLKAKQHVRSSIEVLH